MKIILLMICMFSGNILMAQKKYERDTVPAPYAMQPIQEKRDLLKEYTPPSTVDPNRSTIVVVNQERIAAADTILYIKPENIYP